MKILRSLLVPSLFALLAVPAALAAADAGPLLPFEAAPPAATHPSMYSFADLYRLTVGGAPFGAFRFADSQPEIRVVSETQPAEPAFAVSQPRDAGSRWALALAGLFACAWVAHRRLASPY